MSTPALKIYNTLTRTKEEFRPIDPAHVRMYVCGPTVYDYAHIGNARPLIVFDVLFRLLRHLYGAEHVTYVRNITDVDDKINARAAERGISIRELTEETNEVFQQDVKALGCLEPTMQPRATEHIAQMIAIIERLIASGHAYAADGHVLFDVPSMQNYGRLSRRSLDEMLAGARVDVAPYKRGDMDFVLWKPSKENEPGWDSPWGRGRPGWHIECSAMSWAHLGETFDIHGGGIDLVFPHHENEIAQSCCAFGQDVMANYWMHNGFLQVEGEKMSKSLGNFITIHELLHTEKFGGRKWPGEVLRLAMLRTHYRQPIDWTVKALEEADINLQTWRRSLGNVSPRDITGIPDRRVVLALADDLNGHEAIQLIGSMTEDASSQVDVANNLAFLGLLPHRYTQRGFQEAMERITNKFQMQESQIEDWTAKWNKFASSPVNLGELSDIEDAITSDDLNTRIEVRLAARASKNWAESDRIRDELAAMGIALKDNKDGTTTWEVKR
ncbi:cysteine--tRNA ligase [Methylocystis rosea]|uniref:Cysteine--tRNA ligase n=1 Tax=Methylocystis rosea TaxID=173366 RepID=A0A3G8M4Y4_9HYPH|nr:cysteine--tRNA ligase [Methylocystis rosea]AZG76100.1 cysteine--tRNA ligase [Methylocystis rosea]